MNNNRRRDAAATSAMLDLTLSGLLARSHANANFSNLRFARLMGDTATIAVKNRNLRYFVPQVRTSDG